MSARLDPPTRLAQGTGGDATELRAAALLRVLQAQPPRLPPSARARIVARLDARTPPAPRRALWPAAVVAALILFAGGVVGAAWGLPSARHFVGRWLGVPAPVSAPVTPPRLVVAPAPASVEAAAASAPALAPIAELAPRSHPARVARTHEVAAPAEDPVVAESRLLGEAIRDLRQRGDAAAALGALDAYERRFPAGALAPEAATARIDALLALGRRAQALQRLEALSLDHLPRGTELRALRGELRAGRGELGGALDDFSAVLALPGAAAGVTERALYGRGSCRSRLGDVAGARADLTEVLRRFPNGPFAEPARRALRD